MQLNYNKNISKQQLYMRVSPVLVKLNCSVIKHLNQCIAAMGISKNNFMASAKILLRTRAAAGCASLPALMYTKRNAQKN